MMQTFTSSACTHSVKGANHASVQANAVHLKSWDREPVEFDVNVDVPDLVRSLSRIAERLSRAP